MELEKSFWEQVLDGLFHFFFSALFGGIVGLIIITELVHTQFLALEHARYWMHAFWITPLVWGILGIFYYDKMIDTATNIFRWLANTFFPGRY